MTKRIQHVAALKLGTVLGLFSALFAFVSVPIMLYFDLAAPGKQNNHVGLVGGIVVLVLLPIFYAMFGFIGGVIAAAIYNLVATWTGGIELTLADPPQRPTR